MGWPWRQSHRGFSLRLPKRFSQMRYQERRFAFLCQQPRGDCARKQKALMFPSGLCNVAVREGFEPSIRCRIHTFQACSFSHSDTSPNFFSLFYVLELHIRWRAMPRRRGVM